MWVRPLWCTMLMDKVNIWSERWSYDQSSSLYCQYFILDVTYWHTNYKLSKFGLPTWNIGNVDLQNNTSFAGFEVEIVAKEAMSSCSLSTGIGRWPV